MTEKLQKILEEINSKQRTGINDISITLEELLSKDANGITLLEHLLKNSIYVNYYSINNFCSSLEAAYIYYKCGEKLYFFELNEDDLFKEINGERFIETLAKNDAISTNIIIAIQKHTEIVDILFLNNQQYYCAYLSESIISNLMKTDLNGKYYIEKYFDNENSIKALIPLINNPEVLVPLCKKYDKMHLLEFANEKSLMYEIDENATVLDYLLDKKIIPKVLKTGSDNVDFVNLLRKKGLYESLINFSEKILLTKFNGSKTLLEEILEKGYKIGNNKFISREKTVKILHDAGCLALITNTYEPILLKSAKEVLENEDIEEQTILEYFLNKGYNPLISNVYIYEEEIIKIFCRRGDYSFLGKKLNEKGLLLEVEPGISVIDKLLDSRVNIEIPCPSSDVIVKKIFGHQRFDLLVQCNLEHLMNLNYSYHSYLDYLLSAVKLKEVKCDLNKLISWSTPKIAIAQFYLTLAKNDMMEYVDNLDEEQLLKKDSEKTLLEELLELDTELTLSKVLPQKVKSKIKVSAILKSKGIEQKNVDVPVKEENFTKQYLKDFENTLGIGPLFEEGEILLKKLEKLFLSDGKSDLELISALVSGYRQALHTNYSQNIQELQNLIKIKQNNFEDYTYLKELEDKAYFKAITGTVYCYRPDIETVLHETGHALHHYLTQRRIPDEYSHVIEKIQHDKEILGKVEKFSDEYNEIKKAVRARVSEKLDSFFKEYYDSEKITEIKEYVLKSREDKKGELKSLGISENSLDVILNTSFTQAEYINHQKRIFIEEYLDDILGSEFSGYCLIGDILDAIYEGEFYSKKLKNVSGNIIKSTTGHGISYYSNEKHGFDEMIANFSVIVKHRDSDMILYLLRTITGEELHNMLNDFYCNNISKTNESELNNKVR